MGQLPTEILGWYFHLPVFALVVSRIAGALAFVPLIGGVAVPSNLRAVLALALALLAAPLVRAPAAAPDTPLGLALALAGEWCIGALLGLVLMLAFLALQMGGLLIAQESGLAFNTLLDPTTEHEESVVSVFYLQVAGVVFLLVGGHREIIRATLDTFEHIPLLGAHQLLTHGPGLLFDALAMGLELALRIAAPTVLTLFLVNMALGFVARTVPQLNVITIGFALKGLVSFVVIAVTLPIAMTAFTDGLEWVVRWIETLHAA
ncbi:MAG: flagellar biosynthetic protein FliR [Phycisphaerae bacterium]